MAREMSQPPHLARNAKIPFHYLDFVNTKFKHFAMPMLNGMSTFFKLNPALTTMLMYVFFVVMGFMLWIMMRFLDLTTGTHLLQGFLDVIEELNEHVLPGLQLLNELLALLFGIFTLLGVLNINSIININVNSNDSGVDPYKTTLSRRYKMVRALPRAKYECLRRRSDVNRDDSSSCAICLGCFREDDEVRILPNCKHYFHMLCIDRWLFLCPTSSSCPLCRASVIGIHSWEANQEEIRNASYPHTQLLKSEGISFAFIRPKGFFMFCFHNCNDASSGKFSFGSDLVTSFPGYKCLQIVYIIHRYQLIYHIQVFQDGCRKMFHNIYGYINAI